MRRAPMTSTEVSWKSRLKKVYGITPETWDSILRCQGGRCAICESNRPGGLGQWSVDHCHETGQVRGLLCGRCNLVLGYMGDSLPLAQDTGRRVEAYLLSVDSRMSQLGSPSGRPDSRRPRRTFRSSPVLTFAVGPTASTFLVSPPSTL